MPLPKKVFLFILQNYCGKIQKEPLVSILTLFLVSLRNNNYV